MSDVTTRVREFVLRAARLSEVDDEEDLVRSGRVNSLFLAQVLTFVEEELGVEVPDEDLTVDTFRSIGSISRMVERRQAWTTLS